MAVGGSLARRGRDDGVGWQTGEKMNIDIADNFATVLAADPQARIDDIRVGADAVVGQELQLDEDPTTWRSWRCAYVLSLLAADSAAAVLAILFAFLARPNVAHGQLKLMGWSVSYKMLGLV